MKKFYFLFLTIALSISFAQVKQPYNLFNKDGKPISYEHMINEIKKSDMLLFGELHNNAIAHWLQLAVTKELLPHRKLILGAEMFEADNQEALNLYVQKEITEKKLDSLARLWKNFKTDYKPLVDVAKENNLIFVAANVPRRYAAMVARGGFESLDTLSQEQKKWIAPLPIEYDAELSQYKEMLKMREGHAGVNLPKAQALKDATMAHFILENYNPGSLFIHYHGTYHTDFYQGILWYLQRKQPKLNYITISTVTQKDITQLEKENIGKADFIICVDEDMTTTY